MTTQEEENDKRQLDLARSILLSERSTSVRSKEKQKRKIYKELAEEQYTGLKDYVDPYIFNLLQKRARDNAVDKINKLNARTTKLEEDEEEDDSMFGEVI